MIHYIAEFRRQELKQKLAQAKFFPCFWMGRHMQLTSTMSLSLHCGAIEMERTREFTHEWNTSLLFGHSL